MKISIRNKITIIILVLILTAVTTLGLMIYGNAKEILIEDMKFKNYNTLSNIDDYFLKNFMESMEYVIQYWSQDENIINYKNKPNQPKMVTDIPDHFYPVASQWKGFIAANPDVAWIYLGVEEDGSLLLSPIDPKMPEEYDCRERDWYISAVENDGKIVWTEPYLDAGDSGEVVVTVAKAIKKGEDLVGVVAIDIKLNKFSEIIKNLILGDDGYLMLMSNDGDIYAHPDKNMLLNNIGEEGWLQEVLLNDSGTDLYASTEEKDIIISYLTVPETGWKFVGMAKIDIEEMLTPIRNQVVIIAFISTVITLILGLILSGVITKPVEQMMQVINKISKGKMGVRTDIRTRDEFRVLGTKFNEMLQEIEGLLEERNMHVQELTKKNQEIMVQNEEIMAFSEETEAMNEELASLLDEVRRNYLSTVKALANSIEANDEYTRGHCERVRDIAMSIARIMNFPQFDIDNLEFASLLHDIGKIGIPSEILNKVGKLSVEEYEIVKKHPGIAFRILEDIEFLKESREIIYQHHERVDGKGYPHHLTEKDISLSAKILAVADAYDAMTSVRPYREVPFTKEEAMEELQKRKGTQFDSKVVDTFVSILTQEEILINTSMNEYSS
ncbi:HD domain-containing phosphohydrolase [Anaerovirgula multivorans]|uniref:HD domain-containing phosphohydrolase n=1 Tax=Anaerovirgula multivorans TaxID=312168 RepID=UPI0015957225|nr:HD domain-containing phosphohydrolase [Anaerovirgula multivorans]